MWSYRIGESQDEVHKRMSALRDKTLILGICKACVMQLQKRKGYMSMVEDESGSK